MNFWARLAQEMLALSPQIIQNVWTDKANMPHESKVAAATTAALQASQVAQEIDPGDTDKINAATAVTGTIISALQAPPPAQASQPPLPAA